ncbi:unnamed protein product (macronuclear) [Paramecium tetraurelia]|uniref:Protein kinase domain-containing protein n=1 Tax=Paramecium tetraurelia TaxID=5888 RepID=A0BJ64_PARTE|nr:uncharacterized protein GSPATT00004954001 [Paramecium tetraurelia]CAK58581.1 unnamed protein product [Paramecium tetraurelia]|eukprot:XP_001425979.1 hypothetical protein (macronuclear) [Paramecium tetraurelia strain d4-2]
MFLTCCPNLYSMLLKTQINLIDNEILLSLDLQPPYKAILKKDFLHIYKDEEPLFSLPLSYPNLISWQFQRGLVGFMISNTIYFTDQAYKLKEFLNGKLFFSRIQDFYTPLQVLGQGSSAKVLLVKSKQADQYFAAKCVEKNELMYQEIEINNELDHPAFVKVKEVFQGDTSYYIIMDLLSGKNLQQLMKNQHVDSENNACKLIVKQALLSGIEHMHQKNIMHRDIKPENIVLQKNNNLTTLKIVDFGLATYTTLKKFKYPKCGTPGYVAPEIANLTDKDATYSSKCDIFSAGALFFKLLTGRDVFPGTGFNFVLQLNKKCHIDFSILTLKKVPPNVIVINFQY